MSDLETDYRKARQGFDQMTVRASNWSGDSKQGFLRRPKGVLNIGRMDGFFPPPTGDGACCVGGCCSIKTPNDCFLAGGDYQGNDTVCAPNPCPWSAYVTADAREKTLYKCGFDGFMGGLNPYLESYQPWTFNASTDDCTSSDDHNNFYYYDPFHCESGEIFGWCHGSNSGGPTSPCASYCEPNPEELPYCYSCCLFGSSPDTTVSDSYAYEEGADPIGEGCEGATGKIEFILAVPYTDEMLVSNVQGAMPAYDDDFGDSGYAYRNFVGNTLTLRRFKYKFTFASPCESKTINWIERFSPEAGGDVDTPKSFVVAPGMTESPVYEVLEPDTNGIIQIIYPIPP
jgi:hypothetical protein